MERENRVIPTVPKSQRYCESDLIGKIDLTENHKRKRFNELKSGLIKYISNGMLIDVELIEEYNELRKYLGTKNADKIHNT